MKQGLQHSDIVAICQKGRELWSQYQSDELALASAIVECHRSSGGTKYLDLLFWKSLNAETGECNINSWNIHKTIYFDDHALLAIARWYACLKTLPGIQEFTELPPYILWSINSVADYYRERGYKYNQHYVYSISPYQHAKKARQFIEDKYECCIIKPAYERVLCERLVEITAGFMSDVQQHRKARSELAMKAFEIEW